ncbi:MAG: response regulator [Nitriliruptor sp.]|nr:MAG: response regulator [Nitriliruptor sp.]
MSARILVADDDEDIRAYLEVTLQLAGFEVLLATDGAQALTTARTEHPDVVVLDVMMPNLDGIEALRQMREDPRTSHLPVMLLTARVQTGDAITGLDAGADDYLTKPFDPDELVARVRAAIRRADTQRTRNPLTGLPGNESILTKLAQLLAAPGGFALLYVDLDRFKPFNDHYGFLRGDEALVALGSVLQEVRDELDDPEAFVGHVGGDDFVVLVRPDLAEPTASMICTRFDAIVPSLYDAGDLAAGGIEVTDRRGVPQRFELLSLSIGIASTAIREFGHHGDMVATATEMKRFAKGRSTPGSAYRIDRRSPEDGVEMEVELP